MRRLAHRTQISPAQPGCALHQALRADLGVTLDLLARAPAGTWVALQPQRGVLLAARTEGFVTQSRGTILREQEEVRTALLAAQQHAEERLQHAEHLRARAGHPRGGRARARRHAGVVRRRIRSGGLLPR